MLGGAGGFFGAIAAPELEPRAFRYPALWQVAFAVVGSVLVALLFGARGEGLALAVILGVFAGYLAPFWVTHVPLP